MPAARRASQDEIARAVKAMTLAGIKVGAVEIAPDGTVRIVAGDGRPPLPSDAWDRATGAER